MKKHLEYQRVTNHDQNFFQLGSIQASAVSLPAITFGGMLGGVYGSGTALGSIFIGNLILWVIGLAIISMVSNDRINAIENIKDYLGKAGTIIFAVFLVLIFLDWFAFQINSTVFLLNKSLQFDVGMQNDMVIRIGATLGLITSLFSIGGIRLLKWVSVISVFFLFFVQVFALFYLGKHLTFSGFGFSFYAVIATIFLFLPGLINLPTFFRHSYSKADSYLGLTFMMVYYTFFECTGIWIDFNKLLYDSAVGIYIIFFVFLILLSFCSNLLNIYLASACYETFIPRFVGTKGHAIMGLLGTAAYTFFQISAPIEFVIQLLNAYLISLCTVLLISFLVRVIVNHRPRKTGKAINTMAWMLGCIVATVLKIQTPSDEIHFLLAGMGASMLFFLVVMYIEETIWAAKKVLFEKTVE